jgi:hypothetical protein
MASWVDDFKFPLVRFHFRTLAFTVGDDDKLELQDQEQEEQLQRQMVSGSLEASRTPQSYFRRQPGHRALLWEPSQKPICSQI